MFHRLAPLLLCLLAFLGAAPAAAQNAEVQTTWRLLDYVAVDYREAVRDGRIVNEGEYKEMAEFTASVSQRLSALPEKPAKAKLVAGARPSGRGHAGPPPEIEKQAAPRGAAVAAYRCGRDVARGGCGLERGNALTPRMREGHGEAGEPRIRSRSAWPPHRLHRPRAGARAGYSRSTR